MSAAGISVYFRHHYKLPDKARLDGIVYPSAQRKRGKSIVIFASRADLDPRTDAFLNNEPPPLALDPATIRRVRKPRRVRR